MPTNQIRLSPDVEAIAKEVAQIRGLGTVRVAIEAIVRTQAKAYLNTSQNLQEEEK
ncbi:MAG: hypothetical protein F6K19_44675 [Cyanothece sp. SIO1E1]|nr:hypothetical protein [Cyanothece sp. SIO1E1]